VTGIELTTSGLFDQRRSRSDNKAPEPAYNLEFIDFSFSNFLSSVQKMISDVEYEVLAQLEKTPCTQEGLKSVLVHMQILKNYSDKIADKNKKLLKSYSITMKENEKFKSDIEVLRDQLKVAREMIQVISLLHWYELIIIIIINDRIADGHTYLFHLIAKNK